MGLIVGVDGGNTKTDLLVVTREGEPVAYVRGPGSNSHGAGGADGAVAVIAALAAEALAQPADHGAFFLCGADVPADVETLEAALAAQPWVRAATVDNDTFALLRAGTDAGDAVAVVCGGGLNCVGRRSGGRVVRYPSLGWETGDLGGAEALGRVALYHAARAEDGRGPATALLDVVRRHFALPTAAAVGEAVHYRGIPETRLGELAPAVVATAAAGDAIAAVLVERLAEEVALLVERAVRDLGLVGGRVAVVLGGGMLADGKGLLYELVLSELAERVPRARASVPRVPAVVGAALAALDAAGAGQPARERLRASASGYAPRDVR